MVCIGMPAYNSEKYVEQAITSLLNQDFADFVVIAVDDCSTDKTGGIIEHCASKDHRVKYLKNKNRLGMIMNWRKAFAEACKMGVDYFAWASDHDLWDSKWLQNHVNILNQFPQVVLTYPLSTAIDANGKPLMMKSSQFETFGLDKRARVRKTCTKMVGAGNMIYGLFRASTLRRHNVFPYFSMPDRLLLMQVSVSGTFKQIKKHLWYRRYMEGPRGPLFPNYAQLIERHRNALFVDRNIPWHSNFPALGQAIGLIRQFSVKPAGGNYQNASLGLYMALLHLMTKRRNLRKELGLFLRRLPARIQPGI